MRHRKKNIKLGRVKGPRTALLRSLAESLVLRGAITTTLAKAKALRHVVEPLVTKAKKNRPVDRTAITSFLYTRLARNKLLKEIAPRYLSRQGGYTRVTKLGRRLSDSAETARIEFV